MYRKDVCGGYTQDAGYAWGPDLAGRIVGGDGTGGLASVYSNGRTYFPIHDGRGNVWGFSYTEPVITRNLTTFGDGAFNPYQGVPVYVPVSLLGFAHGTKEFIPALGLYLFGRRFYDPKTGRFLNRDPIAEDGGLNLYRFVSNNPVNSWDYNGLESMVDLLQQDPTIAPPSPTREYRPDSRWNVGINFNLGGGGRVDREEREERVDRCEELKREFERSRNDASFAAEDAIRQVLLALGEIAPIQTSSYEWGSLIYQAPEGYSRTSLLRGSPADPQNMGSYGLHDEQLREASMTYRRRSDGSLVIDTLDRKRIGGVAHGHTIDDLKGGQLSLADYVGGLSAYGLIGAVTAHTGHLYLFDARSMPENERERIQETLTKLIARQKADPNTLYTAENAFLSVPEDMWAQLARNTVTCPNFFE